LQVPKGNPYHSATSGEMAIYRANSLILRKVMPLAYSFGEEGTLANGHGLVLKLFVLQLNELLFHPLSRLVHR